MDASVDMGVGVFVDVLVDAIVDVVVVVAVVDCTVFVFTNLAATVPVPISSEHQLLDMRRR